MRQTCCKIACRHSLLQLDPMDKGQQIGDLLKYAAYQIQIKPNAGKPSGQIGQQRAADTTYLLLIQQAAKQ